MGVNKPKPILSIDLEDEDFLVHSERFVDSWVKKAFIWRLAALFVARITQKLNWRCFSIGGSDRKLRQPSLPPALSCSYSVSMVSICRHEIKEENFILIFIVKVHES